ncbi:MAG: carboxymuconolactone decarboxylase family protein [Chitinophagales bacterium]|nr:carboxymuconolactone decarboxylase family protein [Chitinophagales bacterium]
MTTQTVDFKVPSRDELSTEGQALYDGIHKAFGKVPNLYAYIGKSANTLGAYLAFQQAQAKGSFKAKEREAVFLAVSQVNNCRYCQSVHTVVGKMNGLSEEETLEIRQGRHSDPRLNAIVALAKEVTETKGRPNAATLENFFAQGFDEAALIDLIALVVDKTLANYVHNITQIEIDWPLAKEI